MINIIKNGILCTLQGNYRHGYMQMGIPWSGPMDDLSMMGANYLTGNDPLSTTLEMIIQGPEIRFKEGLQFAICGADMKPTLNGRPVPQNTLLLAERNDLLSFSPSENGLVTYLSFGGKIKVDKYLKSTSTHVIAGLGGYFGRPLKAGDALAIEPSLHHDPAPIPNYFKFIGQQNPELRVLKGPELYLLNTPQQVSFIQNSYTISDKSNRMGIRLEAISPIRVGNSNITSSAVIPGTIQLPESGNPIVMMRDHQTTGGYLRVGNIINHDLSYLSQTMPGNRIKLRWVTYDKSMDLNRKKYETIEKLYNERALN
ncbi:MAG: biotin-dependent carboxyltransferase family protein [Cyclobacteriaceae bacterium]